ncbi:metallophosphoesterase [Terrabacter sp. NPDC000476]|uniref:metallophosphoesterase family protein n=1 Tax=Terrabacter sp. NPDC000476 TaxID=3154258 RepID=UPI00331A1EA5
MTRPPTRRGTRRRTAVWAAVGAVLVLVLLSLLRSCQPPPTVTVVAAGDMACDVTDPSGRASGSAATDQCQAQRVSDVAMGLHPDLLLGLGDYQYEVPAASAYRDVYGPGWGRLRDVTIPAIGNQEYKVHDANTFHDYFGERSGPDSGYWSTDVGAWHVVVLNSNCTTVKGGCRAGSPQQRWLEADLAASDARCTVALMHHPRWSNGIAGPDTRLADLVDTLVGHGVDLMLSGHEADYERFAARDAQGRPSATGIVQMVAGNAGQAHYLPGQGAASWRATARGPAGAYFDGRHHGVLALTLRPDGWDWSYRALTGRTGTATAVADSGRAACH